MTPVIPHILTYLAGILSYLWLITTFPQVIHIGLCPEFTRNIPHFVVSYSHSLSDSPIGEVIKKRGPTMFGILVTIGGQQIWVREGTSVFARNSDNDPLLLSALDNMRNFWGFKAVIAKINN